MTKPPSGSANLPAALCISLAGAQDDQVDDKNKLWRLQQQRETESIASIAAGLICPGIVQRADRKRQSNSKQKGGR